NAGRVVEIGGADASGKQRCSQRIDSADVVESEGSEWDGAAGIEWIEFHQPVVSTETNEVIAPRLARIVDNFPGVHVTTLLEEILFRVAENPRQRDAET